MKTLVTGATGFAGSHLTRKLVGLGHEVRILVRSQSNIRQFGNLDLDVVVGKIEIPADVDKAARDRELVYHLAANYRVAGVKDDVYWQTNLEGTKNVVDASLRHGIEHLIHCSTVGVHGRITDPPANERTAYAPGDIYQRSKTEAEKIVRRAINEEKLPATIFRPAAIYGPGDTRLLKLFRAIKRRRFMMIGSGEVLYHLIYVNDLVDGILCCSDRDPRGQVYILAGDDYVRLKDLVRMIASTLQVPIPRLRLPVWPVYGAAAVCELVCKQLRVEPPLYRRRLDFFRKDRAFEITKAKREIGFAPRVPLEQGIASTANWYLEHGWI